jgi:outer membrane protein TolC
MKKCKHIKIFFCLFIFFNFFFCCKCFIPKYSSILKFEKNNESNLDKEKSLNYSLTDKSIDINVLINEVVKRNPDLEAFRLRIKAAQRFVARVQIPDDPMFTFKTMGNQFTTGRTVFHSEKRYEFSQKIPFPGKLETKGRIASHLLEQARADKITTLQELVLQTKKLHFQLYLNKVENTINKQNQDILTRLIKGALALYKTGKRTQSDALKANIELQKLQEQYLNLESEKASLKAFINAFLNRDPYAFLGEPQIFYIPKILLNYEQLETLAMNKNPELKNLREMVYEQNERKKLARLNYFPDFDAGFMIQDKSRNKAWGVHLSLNIPLWFEQKQDNEVKEVEAMQASKSSMLMNLQATIRGRIKEILAKIESEDEKITLYESGFLKKTAQILVSNEAYYRSGKGDFLMVLDTRRQFQDFEFDYERVRVEREILFAELERVVGIPLEEIFLVNNKYFKRDDYDKSKK